MWDECLEVVRRRERSARDAIGLLAFTRREYQPIAKRAATKPPHEISFAAKCSQVSSSKARPNLPWAQGVAGSNPVAPTTFRGTRWTGDVEDRRDCPPLRP